MASKCAVSPFFPNSLQPTAYLPEWLRLTLDNNRKIKQVINHLISKGIEIEVRLKGEKTIFTSRFMKVYVDANGGRRE